MAIIKEEYMTRADGVKLYRTYSDEGKFVIQNETGIAYAEAIDVENATYTYSESDEEHGGAEMSAEEFVALILGGES